MDEHSFFSVPWLHANSLESRWLIHWRNFALWIIHFFSLLSQIIGDGRTFPHLSEGVLISFKHSYSAQMYIFQDLFLSEFFFFPVGLIVLCSNLASNMKVWLGIESYFCVKKIGNLFPMLEKILILPSSFLPYRHCLYPKTQSLPIYFKMQTSLSIYMIEFFIIIYTDHRNFSLR